MKSLITMVMLMLMSMSSALANQIQSIVDDINDAARHYNIDPRIIAAIIKIESDFNVYAVSPKGAQGLMQLMPITQKEMGLEDPFDQRANIFAGTGYFVKQYRRFDSDLFKALWAYNAGAKNVVQKRKPKETMLYTSKVLLFIRAEVLKKFYA